MGRPELNTEKFTTEKFLYFLKINIVLNSGLKTVFNFFFDYERLCTQKIIKLLKKPECSTSDGEIFSRQPKTVKLLAYLFTKTKINVTFRVNLHISKAVKHNDREGMHGIRFISLNYFFY